MKLSLRDISEFLGFQMSYPYNSLIWLSAQFKRIIYVLQFAFYLLIYSFLHSGSSSINWISSDYKIDKVPPILHSEDWTAGSW